MTHFISNKLANEKGMCWAPSSPHSNGVRVLSPPTSQVKKLRLRNQSLTHSKEHTVLFRTQVCLAFFYHDLEQSLTKGEKLSGQRGAGGALRRSEAAQMSFAGRNRVRTTRPPLPTTPPRSSLHAVQGHRSAPRVLRLLFRKQASAVVELFKGSWSKTTAIPCPSSLRSLLLSRNSCTLSTAFFLESTSIF